MELVQLKTANQLELWDNLSLAILIILLLCEWHQERDDEGALAASHEHHSLGHVFVHIQVGHSAAWIG